jgi:hypothetical protein
MALCEKLLIRCLYPTPDDQTLCHKDRPDMMQPYRVIYFDLCYDLDIICLSKRLSQLKIMQEANHKIAVILDQLTVYQCPSPMHYLLSVCNLDDYISHHPETRFIILDGHDMAMSSPSYFQQSLQLFEYYQKKYCITVLFLHYMDHLPPEWRLWIDKRIDYHI